ncbi:23322_t:CDS:2, partial [Gigaspora rosea]
MMLSSEGVRYEQASVRKYGMTQSQESKLGTDQWKKEWVVWTSKENKKTRL